jgi:alkylation response protein AidB-like acyl-CoA dehydrogenase
MPNMDEAQTKANTRTQPAGLSGEELVARAAAMVPALRMRAQAAEEAGRIPEATFADAIKADLFRTAVPRRFGGHEADFKYIPQIIREWGRGCSSSSWVLGFLMYHNFQHGHFPEKSQAEMWRPDGKGYTLSPGQIVPAGKAEPVEGGYRLTGMWPYASGIYHGDVMLMSAPVVGSGDGSGAAPEIRRFIMPISEVRILDTWQVSAMRATGSHNVEVDGVFVPEHRSVNVAEFRENLGPGLELNTGPLWQVPMITYLMFGAVAVMLGGAEAVFELVTDILKDKVGAYDGVRFQQQMTTRVRLAECQILLQSTRGLFDDKIAYVSEKVGRGERLSREERMEMRMVISYIGRQSAVLAQEVGQMAGSRAKFLDSPIQRFQRDISSLATHAAFEFENVGNQYGGMLLGVEPPPEAMI